MEVNPARAATGASISAATTAAFVNMLRVFTIHGTSIGDIISNISAANKMNGRVLAHADCMAHLGTRYGRAALLAEALGILSLAPRLGLEQLVLALAGDVDLGDVFGLGEKQPPFLDVLRREVFLELDIVSRLCILQCIHLRSEKVSSSFRTSAGGSQVPRRMLPFPLHTRRPL